MGIGNANVTAGNDFSSGDTVTDTTLDQAANPTVALGFAADTDTGLSNPSADVMGLEAGGTEVMRVSSAGIQTTYGMFRNVDNSVLTVHGGTTGAGANIELYGGTHATLADDAIIDADEVNFRSAAGAASRGTISGSGWAVGGTGDAIKAIWHTTAYVSPAPISAQSEASQNVTVTGAAVGDAVIVNAQTAGFNYVTLDGFVVSANTVTVMIKNPSGVTTNFGGTVTIMVFDLT